MVEIKQLLNDIFISKTEIDLVINSKNIRTKGTLLSPLFNAEDIFEALYIENKYWDKIIDDFSENSEVICECENKCDECKEISNLYFNETDVMTLVDDAEIEYELKEDIPDLINEFLLKKKILNFSNYEDLFKTYLTSPYCRMLLYNYSKELGNNIVLDEEILKWIYENEDADKNKEVFLKFLEDKNIQYTLHSFESISKECKIMYRYEKSKYIITLTEKDLNRAIFATNTDNANMILEYFTIFNKIVLDIAKFITVRNGL